MKRRSALRNLLVIGGGITLLPSCSSKSGKASIALKNFSITEDQEKRLADIASTIIPKTDTPGAKEMGAHLFVLKMLDDCYEKDEQQKFVQGLDQLEGTAKERYGHSFIEATPQQKETVLEEIENKKNCTEEMSHFYQIMKERTIQGFMTSKFVVIDVQKYEIIPSVKYNGYYPNKSK